ncbi:MAG: helix-turn-helix domain-containing protein [Candidatus Methanomethylicia archaeon]
MKGILEGLKSLVLSSYEAKAYLTLLDNGSSLLMALSRNSNIPPRVYAIVEDFPSMDL